jgi:hypothetical protein
VDARRASSKEIPLKGLTAIRRAKPSFLFSDATINKQMFSNLGETATFQKSPPPNKIYFQINQPTRYINLSDLLLVV